MDNRKRRMKGFSSVKAFVNFRLTIFENRMTNMGFFMVRSKTDNQKLGINPLVFENQGSKWNRFSLIFCCRFLRIDDIRNQRKK